MAKLRTYILGTGGHAQALRWIYPSAIHVAKGEEAGYPDLYTGECNVVVGWLGQTPAELEHRVEQATKLAASGVRFFPWVTIMPTASVDPSAHVGVWATINQGAVVCHDCAVGLGAHVGPGAVVCGGATIGRYSMVGAGAVVLPGASVPQSTLVKAGERYPK